MIELFSRYAFKIAVKRKSGKIVLERFEELIKEFHLRFEIYPMRCQADEGDEFFNVHSKNI